MDPFELAEAWRFGANFSRVLSQHPVDLEVMREAGLLTREKRRGEGEGRRDGDVCVCLSACVGVCRLA